MLLSFGSYELSSDSVVFYVGSGVALHNECTWHIHSRIAVKLPAMQRGMHNCMSDVDRAGVLTPGERMQHQTSEDLISSISSLIQRIIVQLFSRYTRFAHICTGSNLIRLHIFRKF